MEREDTAGTKPLDRSANTYRGADMEREDLAGTKPLDRSDNNI